MKYILGIIFLCMPAIALVSESLGEKHNISIISRAQWGANEEWTYLDSQEWKDILETRKVAANRPINEAQKIKNKKSQEIFQKRFSIMSQTSPEKTKIIETVKNQNDRPLAWNIQKTSAIESIIIHHTAGNYPDSITGMQSIYKYHSLSRAWGDIGYNYIIGLDGEIFEGRKGGETAVGAHVSWNNRSNLGISIMGNFTDTLPSEKQLESTQKLIKYIIEKYDIDISTKNTFYKACSGEDCIEPLIAKQDFNIIGHTDVGHTSCPGDLFHTHFDSFRLELSGKQFFNSQKLKRRLDLLDIKTLLQIQALLEKNYDKKNTFQTLKLKSFTKKYIKEKLQKNYDVPQNDSSFKKTIKVLLSYPSEKKTITIDDGEKEYFIELKQGKLFLNNQQQLAFKIPESKINDFLKITSWDRKPTWDTTNRYNDNTFRGELIIYQKNGVLQVVNHIELQDYLKGLGEVSNSDNPEKIKTIIIAARTYAQWYMTQARKFDDSFYDASDDPAVFQKYLGYGLESRSPKINSIVEDTKNIYISYQGKIIKPWYSSRSDGRTLSYTRYCIQNNSQATCDRLARDYPYLQSVDDFPNQGQTRLGHGVGISGGGATYFAKKGWSAEMIIGYYLSGIEIKEVK